MSEPGHLAMVRLPEDALKTMCHAPDGTQIIGVHAEWIERSIYVMLEGPLLPECPEGARPTEVQAMVQAQFDDEQRFTGFAITWQWPEGSNG